MTTVERLQMVEAVLKAWPTAPVIGGRPLRSWLNGIILYENRGVAMVVSERKHWRMHINPGWWATLDSSERVEWVTHEALHLCHGLLLPRPQRSSVPVAIAVDVEINDGLGLEIPAERKTLEEHEEFARLLRETFLDLKGGEE